jgi:hypothetical protein
MSYSFLSISNFIYLINNVPMSQFVVDRSKTSRKFTQTEGTAIGSRLGMNHASTYLGSWESQLMEITDKLRLSISGMLMTFGAFGLTVSSL